MTEIINRLSKVSLAIYNTANANLESIEKYEGFENVANETQDYYLGILKRTAMISNDLHVMLIDRPIENLTTPYVLLRSLLDDFLHLMYLDLHEDKDGEIVKINAEAYRQGLSSLINLTDSENQEHYGENLGYLNDEEVVKLKNTFLSKEENKKYFKNIEEFKFHKFKPLTLLASEINGNKDYNITRDRVLFLWKTFSSFVHYSNFSFRYEIEPDENKWLQIEESLQYIYNSIFFAFKYFIERYDLNPIRSKFINNEMQFPIFVNWV